MTAVGGNSGTMSWCGNSWKNGELLSVSGAGTYQSSGTNQLADAIGSSTF
jgi:hypothetical protein